MANVPVIVISSSTPNVGKTLLAINLSAALWTDNYKVKLYAPQNKEIYEFLEKRKKLCSEKHIKMPMPEIIERITDNYIAGDNDDNREKTVIIADIPTAENEKNAEVFSLAHTLISAGKKVEDLQWNFSDSYMELIWKTKKNIAAGGRKYLNWIAVLNSDVKLTDNYEQKLQNNARRYGYRVAEPLHYRRAFCSLDRGYCAADAAQFHKILPMSMEDVYARRDILKLTEFLWNVNKSAQ